MSVAYDSSLEGHMPNRNLIWTLAILAVVLVVLPVLGITGMMATGTSMMATWVTISVRQRRWEREVASSSPVVPTTFDTTSEACR